MSAGISDDQIKAMRDKIKELAVKYKETAPVDAEKTRIYGEIKTFVDKVMNSSPIVPSSSSSSSGNLLVPSSSGNLLVPSSSGNLLVPSSSGNLLVPSSGSSALTAFDKFNGKLIEKQQGKTSGCGRHTLNNLFGDVYFVKGKEEKDGYTLEKIKTITETLIETGKGTIDLSKMCEFLLNHPLYGLSATSDMTDTKEIGTQLDRMDCKNNEDYDITVLTSTLQFLGYDPAINVHSTDPNNVTYSDINDDTNLLGAIVNPGEHWLVVRKYNGKLYKIDSLNDAIEITKLNENIRGSVYPIANYSIYTRMHCFVKFKMFGIMNDLRPTTDPDKLGKLDEEKKEEINEKNKNIEAILTWVDGLKLGLEDNKNDALDLLYNNLDKISITDDNLLHISSETQKDDNSKNIAGLLIGTVDEYDEGEYEEVEVDHVMNTYIVKPDDNDPYYITFDSNIGNSDVWERQGDKKYWVKPFENEYDNDSLELNNVFTETGGQKYLVISDQKIDEKYAKYLSDMNNNDDAYDSDNSSGSQFQYPQTPRNEDTSRSRRHSLFGASIDTNDMVREMSSGSQENQQPETRRNGNIYKNERKSVLPNRSAGQDESDQKGENRQSFQSEEQPAAGTDTFGNNSSSDKAQSNQEGNPKAERPTDTKLKTTPAAVNAQPVNARDSTSKLEAIRDRSGYPIRDGAKKQTNNSEGNDKDRIRGATRDFVGNLRSGGGGNSRRRKSKKRRFQTLKNKKR